MSRTDELQRPRDTENLRARTWKASLGASASLWFVAVAVAASVASAGCGKKGPPLAPIVRIPAQVDMIAARRVGSDVYVTLTVPAENIDSSMPADVGRVEVYGYTGITAPPRARWAELGTLIGSAPVIPAPVPGEPPPVEPPDPNAGATQGASITLVDRLAEDELAQGRVDPPLPPRRGTPPPIAVAAPPVPSAPPPLRRFYLAIPFSPRGRPGPPGAAAEVTLTDVPEPPSLTTLAHDSAKVVLEWEPSGGLLGFILDREITPEPPPYDETTPAAVPPAAAGPTMYNVYAEVAPDPLAEPGPRLDRVSWRAIPPVPANPAPLAAFTLTDVLEFDRERCYSVRAVRGGAESDPSARMCVRPVDIYPPPAPAAPEAVSGEGVISLIWEPSNAPDLGGYLVLRGEPGDATLHPLTPVPIFEASYRDITVAAGRRYVYAIIAVDDRVPLGNRSAPSAQVEETAR